MIQKTEYKVPVKEIVRENYSQDPVRLLGSSVSSYLVQKKKST